MVLFDTNAILRYLLQDNAEMAEAVKKELNSKDCHITLEVVLHAGLIYASTNLDFIDCLLVGYAKIKGHKVFTFDKALKKRL
jgi:predicted nucleic acid-binding protein